MKPLDTLEVDFLGDLSSDTHGLLEVFEFVRLHCPDQSDDQILKTGTDYILSWTQKEWVRLSDKPLYPTTITSADEMMAFIKHHGTKTTLYAENSPSLDITEVGLQELRKSDHLSQPTRCARGC